MPKIDREQFTECPECGCRNFIGSFEIQAQGKFGEDGCFDSDPVELSLLGLECESCLYYTDLDSEVVEFSVFCNVKAKKKNHTYNDPDLLLRKEPPCE